jgi:uncharacterized protein (UPF0297 family)
MEIQANAYNKVIDKDYNELKQLIGYGGKM